MMCSVLGGPVLEGQFHAKFWGPLWWPENVCFSFMFERASSSTLKESSVKFGRAEEQSLRNLKASLRRSMQIFL